MGDKDERDQRDRKDKRDRRDKMDRDQEGRRKDKREKEAPLPRWEGGLLRSGALCAICAASKSPYPLLV